MSTTSGLKLHTHARKEAPANISAWQLWLPELEWQGQTMILCVLAEAGGPEEGTRPALHLCLNCPQPGTSSQPSPVTTFTWETTATPGARPAHTLLQNALSSPLGPVTSTQTWNPHLLQSSRIPPLLPQLHWPKAFLRKGEGYLMNGSHLLSLSFIFISTYLPTCANC